VVLNYIDKVPKYRGVAPPMIMEILVNGKPIDRSGEMDLNHNQNEIQFSIAAVELYAPERMKFSYKVDGLNPRWQTTGSDQKINLFSLQPNDYKLHIKATDYRGSSPELKVPLKWIINPPWYKSKWTYISAVVLVMLIFYGYVKFRERNLKIEKKILEEKVEERTHEVVVKNNQLEQKNKDITDSLHYASRIQQAVLHATRILEPYGFIYYRPKDIVSGDFYFIAREKSSIYICAADCTGHGVPGALLSIMGVNMMDRILANNPGILPDVFLNILNAEVAKTLRHDEIQGVNDGMDMALIKIDCSENKLYYAGAYNALYIVKNGELSEYKANRFSIGSQRVQKDLVYEKQSIDINWDERIYLFSDGLADQFGGERLKKLKSSGLKKLLLNIQKYDITEQRDEISKFMRNWRGMEEQIDDILLIGLELTKELKNFKLH
jgi:serine phosphatase RsbU (regulator of sigma subunit)